MTHTLADGQGLAPGTPAAEGIFTRSVRRDLTDLNRQYLELGLRPDTVSDPLFGWIDEVRREIEATDAHVRERMAACPFALFDVRLPSRDSVPGNDPAAGLDGVEDRAQPDSRVVARPAGCIAFAHGALFTAWRLAESAPLAARIAFGLSAAAERELTETCPTRITALAAQPGVVRARWPGHPRFWAMLRGAAQSESGSALRWAHCAGICLMDRFDAGAPGDGPAVQRDPPRR
jgi:hypothetical protein